jgi:hypothetical protein
MRKTVITRLTLAIIYVFSAWIYESFVFSTTNGAINYASAAFFDASFVFGLHYLGDNKLIFDMEKINFTSLCTHAFGFVLWALYMPPYLYNVMLYMLICLQWVRLFYVDPDDKNGCYRLDLVFYSYLGRRPSRHKANKT